MAPFAFAMSIEIASFDFDLSRKEGITSKLSSDDFMQSAVMPGCRVAIGPHKFMGVPATIGCQQITGCDDMLS